MKIHLKENNKKNTKIFTNYETIRKSLYYKFYNCVFVSTILKNKNNRYGVFISIFNYHNSRKTTYYKIYNLISFNKCKSEIKRKILNYINYEII